MPALLPSAESLLTAVPVAIVTLDEHGELTPVNPAAAHCLSCAPGQPQSLARLCSAPQHNLESEILATVQRAGHWEGQLRIALSETVERRYQARFARMQDDGGAQVAIGVLEESDPLFELRQRLDENERYIAVGRMAGGIAHNLNNAMVAVLGYSSMMSGMLKGDPRLSRFIDRIVAASQRAADLIRQFLSFSRTSDLQPVLLSLGDVAEIAAKLYIKSDPPGVTLDYHIEPNLPLVRGTPFSLHQALQSLLQIIQDHAPAKPVLARLTSRKVTGCASDMKNTWKAQDAVLVEIAGPCRSETVDALIAQLSAGTAALPDSASMGLELARRVAAEHHGWMEIVPEGGGLRFQIFIPTRAAMEDRGETLAAAAPAARNGHLPAARPAGARLPVILVVDDEDLVLEMAKDLLSEGGYQVLTANRGLSGLETLATTDTIDMVILDRSMPDLDGLEVYGQLRQTRRELPVLISTGHNIEDSKKEMSGDPHLGFIQKPFCFSDLMTAVRGMLAPAPPSA